MHLYNFITFCFGVSVCVYVVLGTYVLVHLYFLSIYRPSIFVGKRIIDAFLDSKNNLFVLFMIGFHSFGEFGCYVEKQHRLYMLVACLILTVA